MKYTYKTKGTCSTMIEFDIEGDVITNVSSSAIHPCKLAKNIFTKNRRKAGWNKMRF